MGEQSSRAKTHALERTSSKGTEFIGRCILCGEKDLPISAAHETCPNLVGWNVSEVLIKMVS